MKRLILILLCGIVYINLYSQFRLDYNVSYASYQMKEMKDLLHSIQMTEFMQKVGIKNVENFPAYMAHALNIGYRINQHEFGIKSSFYTTGGKLSIADYSGAINVKIVTNGYREGLYYKNYFYTYNDHERPRFAVWGEISPAVIISKLKMETSARDIGEQYSLEDFDFNATAFSVLPQLGGKYYLTNNISFDISMGYELSFGGKYDDLKDSPRPDWSGFRLNGGIGLTF